MKLLDLLEFYCFGRINLYTIAELKLKYSKEIYALNDEFWNKKKIKKFITLIGKKILTKIKCS